MAPFIIRVFKSLGDPQSPVKWVNNYEVNSSASAPDDAVVLGMAATIVDAERILHSHHVVFNQVTISTWQPDGQPYDPFSFVTRPLTGTGSYAPSQPITALLPLNVVLYVRKTVQSGRPGKLFFRGCLYEPDIEGNLAGTARITAGSGVAGANGTVSLYRAALAGYLGPDPANQIMLISGADASGAFQFSRPVIDLVAGGVTVRRRDHRYFDRG